jgi:hypothetical protein
MTGRVNETKLGETEDEKSLIGSFVLFCF